MSSDWGMLGDALRKIGGHRERIGARAVKDKVMKSKPVKSVRQKKIDDEIRARRRRRKVEGGYIE